MRLLVAIVALCGAGLLPAHATDAPAQMVTGKRSIEELLSIPKGLQPGR